MDKDKMPDPNKPQSPVGKTPQASGKLATIVNSDPRATDDQKETVNADRPMFDLPAECEKHRPWIMGRYKKHLKYLTSAMSDMETMTGTPTSVDETTLMNEAIDMAMADYKAYRKDPTK